MPRPRPARQLISERNLAARIAYEREREGFSYAGLALRMTKIGCAIDQSAIYKIEKSDPPRRITVDELVGFSEVFGIPIEELLLPPEVAADQAARSLLMEWRSRRAELDDVIRRLAKHTIEHPRTSELIEDLLTDDDRAAILGMAREAVDKMKRSGAFAGKTAADVAVPAEPKVSGKRGGSRGQHREKA